MRLDRTSVQSWAVVDSKVFIIIQLGCRFLLPIQRASFCLECRSTQEQIPQWIQGYKPYVFGFVGKGSSLGLPLQQALGASVSVGLFRLRKPSRIDVYLQGLALAVSLAVVSFSCS